MLEFLRHAIGLCGEPHPSLLTLLMGAPALGYIIYKIKNIIRMSKKNLTKIWLLLSAFGIMFAVLSWLQESNILPSSEVMGGFKGFLAVLTGIPLYWYVAKNMN
tara:strand:+ start:64 stop:375 length:312 start_codon:yes stop_codon:yes gene_type:complete